MHIRFRINFTKTKSIFASNFTNKNVNKKNLIRGDFLNKKNIFNFFMQYLKLNLMFIYCFFNKKLDFSFLFKELFKKVIVDNSLHDIKNCKIIFDNSYMGFTPFWSRGFNRENFLIFYSTNFGYNFDKKSKAFLFPLEYENMNWDNLYVWDQLQKQTLINFNTHSKFKIIGKLNFLDNGEKVNLSLKHFNIIIFDIAPKNLITIMSGLNLGDNFYTSKYMINFLNNIVSFKSEKVRYYIKQKRKIKTISKSYTNNLKRLTMHKKITLLNDEITPERIIEKADLVISPVYSTPSLIAKLLNIPYLYYDPNNKVKKKYKFNRGIPILTDQELHLFISKIYKKWRTKSDRF